MRSYKIVQMPDKYEFQTTKIFQSAHQPTGHALTQFSNLSSGSQPHPPTYHTTGEGRDHHMGGEGGADQPRTIYIYNMTHDV